MSKFNTEQQQRIVALLKPSINKTRTNIEVCTNHIFQLKNILGLKNGDLKKAEEKISKLEDEVRLDESIINLVFDTGSAEEETNPSDTGSDAGNSTDNGSEGNNSNDNNTEEDKSNESAEESNAGTIDSEEVSSAKENNNKEELISSDDGGKKIKETQISNINQELKEAIQKKESIAKKEEKKDIKKSESEIHKDALNFYEAEIISIKNKAHLFGNLNHHGIMKATNILNQHVGDAKDNFKLYMIGSQPYDNNIEKYKKAISSLLKNNEFLIPNKMPRNPSLSEINVIA